MTRRPDQRSLRPLVLWIALAGCGARTGLPGGGDGAEGGAGGAFASTGGSGGGGAAPLVDACPDELGVVTTIDQGLDDPFAMAIDDSYVYVGTLSGRDAIRRYPKQGGSGVVIRDELSYVDELVAHGGRVFYTEETGGVRAIDPDGSNELTLASADGPAGLDVDDSTVVFAEYFGGNVVAVARNGGVPRTLATGLSAPYRVALVGERVFFTSSSPGVQYVSLQGGPVSSMGDGAPRTFATTPTHLYWGIGQFGDSRLWRAPLDTLVPELVADLVSFGTFLGSLASDEADVFVSINGSDDVPVASVVRVPQGGGAPSLVAQGASRLGGPVAVDATCIYWIDQGELPGAGRLLRTRKP